VKEILSELSLNRLVSENPLDSDVYQAILKSCHVLPPGILYFQRLPNPTQQSIAFTEHFLREVAEYHSISHLVWDLRGRQTVQNGLHKKIVQRINRLHPRIKEISVVVDEQNLQMQLTLKFGIRLSRLLQNPIHYSVHVNMESVLDSIQRQIC